MRAANTAPEQAITVVAASPKQAWHGGAWKVAYADFVTAMMAFFLLLWLLASSDQATLDGIAEYFTPTIGVKDSQGIGFEGGITSQEKGTRRSDQAPPGIVTGRSPTGEIPDNPDTSTLVKKEHENQLFNEAEAAMQRAFESDPTLRDLADNVIMEQNPEGFTIEVTDSDKYPMFVTARPELTDNGKRVLGAMQKVIAPLPNYISITGHTDASGSAKQGDYGNWELSSDRALAARRQLLAAGMEPTRPQKIIGKGDSELLDAEDPRNPRNRRITIILLRGSHMNLPASFFSAPRDLLSAPEASPVSPAPQNDVGFDVIE
jgi:chemotaxis protein MotB